MDFEVFCCCIYLYYIMIYNKRGYCLIHNDFLCCFFQILTMTRYPEETWILDHREERSVRCVIKDLNITGIYSVISAHTLARDRMCVNIVINRSHSRDIWEYTCWNTSMIDDHYNWWPQQLRLKTFQFDDNLGLGLLITFRSDDNLEDC
jgi:hypothetical protein